MKPVMFISAVLYSLIATSQAQYPVKPPGLTQLTSKMNADVQISYKETKLCETTPGVKSYAGYVKLPPNVLKDIGANYTINTFFWYFEARHDPQNAPLGIYLAGGPGESSTYAALSSESGPCYVNQDGNSTTLNPWSFNNHVNMLYIDQPVTAGFSYTTLINGTYNASTGSITPLNEYVGQVPPTSPSFGPGTWSNQDSWATTNNTKSSAKALWHFAANWLASFPEYKTKNKNIAIWGNSYGGYWVPATAAHFDRQLKTAKQGSPLAGVKIDTAGITNGCIDLLVQIPYFPRQAYNNTYGQQLIPKSAYEEALGNFTMKDGCRDQIQRCRSLGKKYDPEWTGRDANVNAACQNATAFCSINILSGPYATYANRSVWDMAASLVDGTEPCPYYLTVSQFLNRGWTQQVLGVPLNFTYDSDSVTKQFGLSTNFINTVGTGDAYRVSISDFEYLLQNKIRVAMVYGDRDFRCPWNGAEAISLQAKYADSAQFAKAGYAPLVTNSTYQGGVTRQYNNFSFSRVFQAGHSVSAYQPETVFRIFNRTMTGRDIATGKTQLGGGKNYSSAGPVSSFGIKNKMLMVPQTCMVEGKYQNVSVWAAIFDG